MTQYRRAITAAMKGDMATVDKVVAQVAGIKIKTTARMTTQERKYAAYKRDARDALVGMPWRDLSLKQRATFTAKYEWDPSKGKYGKYVKRVPPLSVSTVYKRMRQQSKRMERMGHQIGKKGARARKHYRPLAFARDSEGL